MALTFMNDIAIHEAGHAVIAYLASDFFEIELVTINPKLSQYYDSTATGGLKGHLKVDGETLTFQQHDLMVLISIAGLAADDVNHGEGEIDETNFENTVWSSKMNSKKYEGDRQTMIAPLQRLLPQLQLTQREYTISCQKLLYHLFTHPPVSDVLVQLRDKITNSPSQTITGAELVSFLNSTPLRIWKQNEWKDISNDRIQSLKKKNISFLRKLLNWFKPIW
jgi:hypothetical protein